jgi:hypothetical protein
MFKISVCAALVSEVFADQRVEDLVKQMNLKENAKNFFGNMQIDTKKLTANSDEIAKQLGLEGGFDLQGLDKSAHEMANDFGLDSYFTQFESQAKDKIKSLDGTGVLKEGQDIFAHMKERAGQDGLGAAFKNGMSEAMAYSQSNPALRDTLTPMKDTFQHYKQGGSKSLMYDAASYAAHNPVVENMLESNGFHVNDLLHKLEPSDPTGKKGLEKLMNQNRAEVEKEFDANNSHFSYFFAFVIFVVCCAISVALYEIYELQRKKRTKADAQELQECTAEPMV